MNRSFLPSLLLIIWTALGACVVQAQFNYESYSFTTFAGVAPGSIDATGSAARFAFPQGVAVDSAGMIYVADSGNNTIRKVTPAGVVSTLAGLAGIQGSADGTGSAARFTAPLGLASDSAGNLYVADTFNHTIRKITSAGAVSTLAGSPGNSGNVDGNGSTARFNQPQGVAVDNAGNVYVADTNNSTIRKITPAGDVSTFAGSGNFGYSDGTGTAADFANPWSLTLDTAGNIYVADTNGSSVRKITPGAVVTTLAAGLANPTGISVDNAGTLYVAFFTQIQKITPAGTVSPFAGSDSGLSGAADGAGAAARFSAAIGVTVNSAGIVYVADKDNNSIRKITPDGVVSTLAGSYSVGTADGASAAARFNGPRDVAVDSSNNVYVVDRGSNTIRKITAAGVVSTFAGSPGVTGSTDGIGTNTLFNFPNFVAVDTAGYLYVSDGRNNTIRKISPGAVVSTLAGLAGSSGSADGTGSAARFFSPRGMAVDSTGNVYVAEIGNHTVRKITPGGVVSTLAGLAGNPGSADGTGSAARFNSPVGAGVDSAGNVYVSESGNNTVRKITPAGVVSTLAGLAGTSGTFDGTGSAARFDQPQGLRVDSAGNVYVTDWGAPSQAIRKITPFGVVTTLGGSDLFGSSDGTGSNARFSNTSGVAVDASGHLYVADFANNTIRLGRSIPGTVALFPILSGHMVFTGIAPPDSLVDIAASSTLSGFGTIATVTADAGGKFQFEDTEAASFTQRFYRANITVSQNASIASERAVRPRRKYKK